ncbi:MAG TPA: hypothetical protein VJR26_15935, partial [Candidatus Acidoferrales bacterium]|nr:hypothetical protein [Candidatus Acidoferrales bacterium]
MEPTGRSQTAGRRYKDKTAGGQGAVQVETTTNAGETCLPCLRQTSGGQAPALHATWGKPA